jgi:hypothetical protein
MAQEHSKFTIRRIEEVAETQNPTQEVTGLSTDASPGERRRLQLINAYEGFINLMHYMPSVSINFISELDESEKEILDFLIPIEDIPTQVAILVGYFVSAASRYDYDYADLLDKNGEFGLLQRRVDAGYTRAREIPVSFFGKVNKILIELGSKNICRTFDNDIRVIRIQL